MNAKAAAAGRKRAQRTILATQCERCGTTAKLSRHHRDGDPTNNVRENVAILCLSCHTTTHWEEGYRPRKKIKVCKVCGEEFVYRHSTNKTCSRECRSALVSANAKRTCLSERGLKARWGWEPAPSTHPRTAPATPPAEMP